MWCEYVVIALLATELFGSAAEYINGTTQNLLVIGQNVTTRSDQRIFSSDRNHTMAA